MSIILAILLTLLHVGQSQTKIELFPQNVTDLFGLNDFGYPAQHLLDEQKLAGDPLNDPTNAGKCVTPWLPVYNPSWYPSGNPTFPGPIVAINLGSVYNVTNICVFTQYGTWNMTWRILDKNPYDTQSIYEFTSNVNGGTWGNHWNCINFTAAQNVYGQFITLSLFNSPGSSLLELVIYGSTKNKPTPIQNYKYTGNTTPLGMLLGTNGFGWTPINNLTNAVGTVREYQDWAFTEGGTNKAYPGYPINQNRFQCSAQGGFCLDDVYGNATKYKLNWHHCMQQTPGWIHNWNESEDNWKPINDSVYFKNAATVDPNNYIMVADHIWQVTARYGRTKVDNSLLKLAPNISTWNASPQPRISGVNLLEWVEIYNEPNCFWTNRDIFFSAPEQAAMQSAAYDGHCGTMPNTVGVKNADKTMNVSLGAIANQTVLDRWQSTVWWSQAFRSSSACFKTFPAEALNVHFYAQNNELTGGISPEDYNVLENMKQLAEWRDRNIPDVQLWVTEYGYDTNGASKYHSPAIGQFSAEQVQGMWIMRSILSFAAANVQRAHQFMWADVNSASGGPYATSGLVTSTGYQPKQGYYYFVCMYRTLKDAYFVDRNCGSDNVCVQIFKMGGKNAYVVWCSTSNDHKVEGYSLKIGSSANNEALLYIPTVGNADCEQRNINVTNGVVNVDVSELPLFVVTK
eukprot:321771_1